MKKILLLFTVAIISFTACSDQSSLTAPEQGTEKGWVSFSNSLSKVDAQYVEKDIDGARGGIITFRYGYLLIPRGAFEGTRTITLDINNNEAYVDFGPDMTFDKPLKFTIIYRDVDLSGIDESGVQFGYMDGSDFVPVNYSNIIVNKKAKVLGVIGAELEHFSRFGFLR
ncbi:MAG: hypothetical protein JW995_14775 [Melioribacteraceae bacterium]|nr:hypothetical protein [Melioribacteraceae bacterium]